jgi:uncharacterized protein with HEPN domain
MLRAAVERELEIVGEALKKLADRDPETSGSIPCCAASWPSATS